MGEGGPDHGMTVHPTPFNQETVFDSAKKYIEQVVNNGEIKHEGEEVIWVRFCACDLNDQLRNPVFQSAPFDPGLIALLGYNTGFQAWHLQGGSEARELISIRNGLKCRTALVLPTPPPGDRPTRLHAAARPWLAAVSGSELKLVSLASSESIKSIMCDGVIEEIDATERIIVVSSQSTISLYSNATAEPIYTIKDCIVPGRDINPFCLGTRLLAYGPDKVDMGRQSLGGYLTAGQRSYTATMLSAAKTLGKGLSYLGESVSKMAGNNPRNYRAQSDEHKIKGHRGIVSVLDLELLLEKRPVNDCIVAHWVGHPAPLGACAFNPAGSLLVTTDITGRLFHIFQINVHPLASADSSVHHLYTLQRGDTTAQIHNFCFSNDSRYLAAVTKRGTTHVFPINPYGGTATVRTHCSARVTNERSLFQISAGLGQHRSGGQPQSTDHSIRAHPRLPPFPNPTLVQPCVQVKQGAMSGLLPPGINIENSEETVEAVFGFNKTTVSFGRDIIALNSRQSNPECLYMLNQYGKLSEFSLETSAPKSHHRVTDSTPLEVLANPIRQWNLQRMRNCPEIKMPLQRTNALLLASDAVTTGNGATLKALFESRRQRTASMSSRLAEEKRKSRLGGSGSSPRSRHSSTDGDDDDQLKNTEWMAKIEMSTYDGPARRLWMGPQFKFTSMAPSTNTQLDFQRSPSSAVLQSEESMKTRVSAPLPITRRRRENSGGTGAGPTIEVGSGHFDRLNHMIDCGSHHNPGSFCGEVKISQLADAIDDHIGFDGGMRRISDSDRQREQATDDETDLIEAIGEFDLQAGGDIESSYNSSSQNSLALN